MLLFIALVECFYLFHKYSKKFIGEDPTDRPTPVMPAQAIDFQLLRGNNTVPYLTIQNGKRKSFDIRYGVWGTLLDFYSTHKGSNQSFLLVLTPNDSYTLVQSGKCVNWSEPKNQFIKMPCSSSKFADFDVFYETSAAIKSSSGPSERQLDPRESEDINREFLLLAGGSQRPGMIALMSGVSRLCDSNGKHHVQLRRPCAARPNYVAAERPEPVNGMKMSRHTKRGAGETPSAIVDSVEYLDEIDVKQFKEMINMALNAEQRSLN